MTITVLVLNALQERAQEKQLKKQLIREMGSRIRDVAVLAYKAKLQADGLAPSAVNLKLLAVRKLAAEAADHGVLNQGIANGIGNTGNFRLTYPAPGAIIALPCPLQAFGLHDSNCLNRRTDDALRLPGLVQLEILPPTTRETLWRLPPRPTSSRQQPCVG